MTQPPPPAAPKNYAPAPIPDDVEVDHRVHISLGATQEEIIIRNDPDGLGLVEVILRPMQSNDHARAIILPPELWLVACDAIREKCLRLQATQSSE